MRTSRTNEARDPDFPAGDAETANRPARFAAGTLYLLLLAGSYSLARVGLDNPFPVPEKAAVALLLLTVLGPALLAEVARKPSLPPARGSTPVFVLLGVLAVSALWSPVGAAPASAIWDLVALSSALLVLVLALRIDPHGVLVVFMAASVLAGSVFAVAGLISPGERIAAFGGGPNVFARVTGMGMIAVSTTAENGPRGVG